MELIQHTIDWCRGEVFEGTLAAVFGAVVVVVAISFWKFGTTPYAKALLIPMLVVGAMYVAAGIGLTVVNQQRIVRFQADYESDPVAFMAAEKKRTETFIKGYPVTMRVLTAMILIALVVFHMWNTPFGRSIALALLLLGWSAMFGDHFSEERGRTYYQRILDHAES